MKPKEPLVHAKYLLEKFPGKGGWTYAEIPEILQNKDNPFGWVKVKGFVDESKLEIPTEIIECFKNESQKLYKTFLSFTEGEQKSYLDWIYDAKTVETQTQRIVKMMERLQKKLRLHDKLDTE